MTFHSIRETLKSLTKRPLPSEILLYGCKYKPMFGPKPEPAICALEVKASYELYWIRTFSHQEIIAPGVELSML